MVHKAIDSHAAFRLGERYLDEAVRRGSVDREKARDILETAREAYRNNNCNKLIDKLNQKKEHR
jgi:hypothetical protein